MAVHAENGAIDVGGVLLHVADHLREFIRDRIAHGIRQVDGGGPRLDGGFEDTAEKVPVAAGPVFSAENSTLSV